jgi:hypothetical protein
MRLSLSAAEPWQLFFSTVLSGAGWAAMGGAAINALIAPWFVRLRPPALSGPITPQASVAILRHNGVDVGKMDFLGPISLVDA